MKILFLFHGMPPLAGRPVVGSGLRAYSLGEGLRQRKHRVFYATRFTDLPEELRENAEQRRKRRPLLLTTITGPVEPPGDPRRGQQPLFALGAAPNSTSSEDPGDSLRLPPSAIVPPVTPATLDGLAPTGGPLGSPGNPFAFTETHEVHEIVRRVDPDVVIVEAIEEARRLPEGRFAVIVDLFAPRILEQQFQGEGDEREAVRVLDALQRGDWFLFSNERQKHFHLPLLALAGVDCTRPMGDVVPLSCPPDPPAFEKPERAVIVAGGVFWPWADLGPALQNLLAVLDARGEGRVKLYGGPYAIASEATRYKDPREGLPPDHPRLDFRGMVPIDDLWREYRRASFAFDLMAPNPERELNLSFRQIDYLRCGLPIVTSPGQVIAADLLQYGAGWVVDPLDARALRKLVGELLDHPEQVARASSAAQRLARDRFASDRTVSPLDAFCQRPLRRSRQETLVARMARTQADLWEDHEENKRLREGLWRLQSDVEKKDDEIRRQDERVRGLLSNVDRLTASLTEVSHWKNSSVQYLHETEDAALRDAAELRLELERLGLDLRKKDGALEAALRDLGRVQVSLRETQQALSVAEKRVIERDAAAQGAEDQARALLGRLGAAERQAEDRRRELRGRDEALAEARAELQRVEGRMLDVLDRAEATARRALLELEARDEARRVRELALRDDERLLELARAEERAALAQAQAQELLPLRAELASLKADQQKKEGERRALLARAAELTEKVVELEGSLQVQGQELLPLRAELASLRASQEKKDGERRVMQGRADELTEKLVALEARAEVQGQELLPLRTELAALRADQLKKDAECKMLQARAEDLGEKLVGLQATVQAQAGELLARRQDLSTARAAAQKKDVEAGDLAQRLDDAAAAQEALSAQVERQAAAARQVPLLKAEIQKKGEEVRALQESVAEARAEALEWQAQADRLAHDVLSHRQNLAAAQADREKKAAELEALGRAAEASRVELQAALRGSEERALAQLERAEQAARTLLLDARDRLRGAQEERGVWKARAEELQAQRRDLEREIEGLKLSLEAALGRVQDERARADVASTDASRLKDRVMEGRVRAADLEAELGRKDLELSSLREDLAATRSRLDQELHAVTQLRGDLEKKERELREQAVSRARGEEEAETARARIEAEVLARDAEIARLKGRIAELEFDRNALSSDVAKKTRELEDTQAMLQRALAVPAPR